MSEFDYIEGPYETHNSPAVIRFDEKSVEVVVPVAGEAFECSVVRTMDGLIHENPGTIEGGAEA